MTMLLATCGLTTTIAIVSTLSAARGSLHQRILPWLGGVLVGIGVFWVLPEMAERGDWLTSVAGVSAIVLLLGLVDRYVYPICPFCACRDTITLGWPLLAVGCLHSFFDGWTIGLSEAATVSNAAVALSWGATIHKLPESAAIGLLAARLTADRTMALGTVALIQTAMAVGGVLGVLAGAPDKSWADMYAMPACSLLLLFGLLALQHEWRLKGRIAALRAAAPGMVASGLFALATRILTH